jgi:UDP-N-acetylglucosamine 2-epimerase (non-hydrolysing)
VNIRYKKIAIVAGARPNFMKVAPLVRAFRRLPRNRRPGLLLVHTGQHYDYLMSQVFFEDLGLPRPDVCLGVRARTPAGQTDEIIARFSRTLQKHRPDLVMVVGDVTSTPACALAARLQGIPVAHVEAGLRSFDPSMPEEANRILTDHLSELLFASSRDAVQNLVNEGIARSKIHLVGNLMIDSLKDQILKIKNQKSKKISDKTWLKSYGIPYKAQKPYVLLTLHRPGNVDDGKVLKGILKAMLKISREVPVLFPAHPRTLKMLPLLGQGNEYRILNRENRMGHRTKPGGGFNIRSSAFSLQAPGLLIVPPLGYREFIELERQALCVFTDSGGIQEETSWLGVPCITIRENTERPVTVELGTNRLAGIRPEGILGAWERVKKQNEECRIQKSEKKHKAYSIKPKASIPKWDGHAAERIVKTIISEQ